MRVAAALALATSLFACGTGLLLHATDAGVDVAASDAAATDSAACLTQPRSPWPMVGHDPSRTSRTTAKGPRSGHVKWTYDVGNVGSTPAIAADGTVYVTHELSGDLLALRPDGSLLWSFDEGIGAYASPTIGCDGTIYVDGDDRTSSTGQYLATDIIVAVTPAGTRRWSYRNQSGGIGSGFDNAPTPGPGGMIVAARGGIYGIRDDGGLVFHLGNDDAGLGNGGDWASRRIAVSKSGVVFGGIQDKQSQEGGTFAIASDGAVQWSLPLMREGILGEDGTFFGRSSTGIDAISENGVIVAHVDVNALSALAQSASGALYFRTVEGLEVVNFSDKTPSHRLVFPLPTKATNVATPPAIDGEGYIYVCAVDKIYVLAADGALSSTIDLAPDGAAIGVEWSSLAIGDGVLYATAYPYLVAVGP